MNTMIAATVYCIVGCNTGSPDKDSLKVSKDGKTLYSVVAEKGDNKSHGALVKFDVENHRIGKMTKLAELPCETPCHVALSPDESVMSVAVYWSGIYGVMALDSRELTSAALPNDAVGPRKDRQQKAFAHQTFYTPDGKLMGVCDLGCDRVNFYDYKKPGGLEKPVITLKADPGDGPRHAIFSNDGKFLFVVNELSSTVTSYAVAKGTTNLVGASFQDARGRLGEPSLPFTRIGDGSESRPYHSLASVSGRCCPRVAHLRRQRLRPRRSS